MKPALIAMLALAPALATALQERNNQNPAPIPGWHPELADGMKEAAQSGKPLMVVFR